MKAACFVVSFRIFWLVIEELQCLVSCDPAENSHCGTDYSDSATERHHLACLRCRHSTHWCNCL